MPGIVDEGTKSMEEEKTSLTNPILPLYYYITEFFECPAGYL
jgi:hypothetical protein